MAFFCGFEAIDTSEYTTGTNITLMQNGTMPELSSYAARLGTTTGAVSWTVSIGSTAPSVASCNFYLMPSRITGMPLRIVRGGVAFYVNVMPATVTTQTKFELHAGASSASAVMDLPISWVNVVITVSPTETKLYVNGHFLLVIASGSTSSITQINATNTGSLSPMLVDDYAVYFTDSYNPKLTAYVMPWVPKVVGDRSVELEGYPAGGNNSSKIDDTTADDDTTYVYTPGNDTYEDLYECAHYSAVFPRELVAVLGVKTHLRARYSTAGSTATAYAGYQIGATGTPVYTGHAVGSGYTTYHDYHLALWKATYFTTLNDPVFLLALKCVASGSVVRVTKFRASILVFCRAKGQLTDIKLTGGLDLQFDIDATGWPSSLQWLVVSTNVNSRPIGTEIDVAPLHIMFTKELADGYQFFVIAGSGSWGDTTEEQLLAFSEKQLIGNSGLMKIRIVIHNNLVSVFNVDTWIHTFSFPIMDFPGAWEINLKASYATDIENIRLVELYDWREAIYIDMATPTGGGISSIIQERPVETNPVSNGVVDYSYNRTRDAVTLGNIYSHKKKEMIVPSAGSHYIVYYTDVAITEDESFMDAYGYLTKVLQLANLDSGAVDVSIMAARRAREQQVKHMIASAPDIRVVPGDKLNVGYTLSGTGKVISDEVIVEGVRITIADGDYTMNIEGRDYVN